MRPKFIVYCLSAICLAFGFKGLFLTENIQNTLKENDFNIRMYIERDSGDVVIDGNITASNLKKAETRLGEGDSKLLPLQNQILFAPSNGK